MVHETTGHILNPGESWSPTGYRLGVAFRYRFGGVAREGKLVYIKLLVENLYLERFLAQNQSVRHNSKANVPRSGPSWATLLESCRKVLVPTWRSAKSPESRNTRR